MTRRMLVVALIFAVAAASVVGCKKDGPEVVANWPEAEAERSVSKPVEPLRWPLTGLDAPSVEAIQQRVVSVKIENSPEARPQTNLQLADVVYESVTEGGITRFNALFHSQAPEVVGPVRSARLSDIHIVPQYHALFAFSGASAEVNAAVRSAGIENLSQDAGISKPYKRSGQRAAPHNLYGNVVEMRVVAAGLGWSPPALSITGLSFDPAASAPATPTITEITIPFSQANTVTWTYDASSNSYLRVNNGRPFNDDGAGAQVSAKNVVVIWAQHNASSRDVTGSTTYDIVLTGSGRATVFRGGQKFDCSWEAGTEAPPVFKAEDGTQVKLAPGNTWMQVINTSVNITMQ